MSGSDTALWAGVIVLGMVIYGSLAAALHWCRQAMRAREAEAGVRAIAQDQLRRAREAEERAQAAEAALDEVRMKRSLAVSKGNRTRAELQRARVLETTAAVASATKRKRQGPQGAMDL